MAAASAPGQPGPSPGPISGPRAHLVNDMAMMALKHSKGIVRVPLEDLGPALFNRQGQATCGKHCQKLAERILSVEGFYTFRYVAGFCHEPDPNNPLAIAHHGNRMAQNDALLPRLPVKPLKGVFAKTHLVTLLQMYKAGQLPELEQAPQATAPSQVAAAGASSGGTSEFQDVLEHGVFMHVFPWWVVRDHLEEVTALMASDNFDHGHGLTDSELRCITAVRAAIAASSQGLLPQLTPQGSAPSQGLSQWEQVRRHVLSLSGQRWQSTDIAHFWDFAKTTLEAHLAVMQEVWGFAGCESVLRVESAWFGGLAKVPAKLQWTRTALVVAHFLSDQDSECSVVGGQCIAGAVPKTAHKKIRERESALSQGFEDWMREMMGKYWETAQGQAPAGRPDKRQCMKGVFQFLARAGRYLMSGMDKTAEQQAKLESKLRSFLAAVWAGALPPPISCDSVPKAAPALSEEVDAEPLVAADSQGIAVVSVKREARLLNLSVGARVTAKRSKTDASQETAFAVITGVSDAGIAIEWEAAAKDGQEKTATVPMDCVTLAGEQKADKKADTAPSQGPAPAALAKPSVKWSECSTAENEEMLQKLTEATLYQAYVGRSCAHDDLLIVKEPSVAIKVLAQKEMKAGTLLLLPFGAVDDGLGPSRHGAAPIAVSVAAAGGPSTKEFRVRGKATPTKVSDNQEKAVAMVPFWLLAQRPLSDEKAAALEPLCAKLEYKTVSFDVPAPAEADKKGPKEKKTNIIVKVVCLVNGAALAAGSMLYVGAPVPSAL